VRLVVVSQRVLIDTKTEEVRDCIDINLIRFISKCGYLPVPIPNYLDLELKDSGYSPSLPTWLENIKPHAFVLSGGNNIGENIHRDKTELFIADFAAKNSLPLLGICRGMQLMSYREGISLIEVSGHVATEHNLSGYIKGKVNSYHEYAIEKCPSGYYELCRSDDNIIEGIKHLILPWEGWMWHPERFIEFRSSDIIRAKSLFQ